MTNIQPAYYAYMGHAKKISDTTNIVSLLEMPNGGASDLLLKKNVSEVTAALERILALRPVTWQWRDDRTHELQHGFIAQDVEEVFPELVTMQSVGDAMPHKFLSTKELLPYLVKAIGEQQQRIDELQAQIEALRK